MDVKSTSHSTADALIGRTPDIRQQTRRLMFSFRGRATRQQYWLGAVVPPFVFMALATAFNLPARMGDFGFTVVGLLLVWIMLAIGVKRCHDRGRSGWFLLVGLIPVLGFFWLLYELGLKDGDGGQNRFGPPPAG